MSTDIVKKVEMYKMYKIVKKSKFLQKRLIQVFHIENMKKGGKIHTFHYFSTLSTLKGRFFVDYFNIKNERTFCEHVMKITFCRKKMENLLTFEKLKYTKKLC